MRYWLSQICLLLLCIHGAVSAQAEVPTELAIGVPVFSGQGGIPAGQELGIQIVRRAVSSPLLRLRKGAADQALFSLVLADRFEVDGALVTWSYRLREDVVYNNGQKVRGADICDSLLKCGRGLAEDAAALVECSVRKNQGSEAHREWIDLRFDASLNSRKLQRGAIDFIAGCPVFEARSRSLFGEDYGLGANIISSGEYRITSFQQAKSYRLERYQSVRSAIAPAPQQVEVLSFREMKDALAALRVGTVALFINTDPEAAAVAAGDETLKIRDCGGAQVIYRRGFQFECDDGIQLSSILWNLP